MHCQSTQNWFADGETKINFLPSPIMQYSLFKLLICIPRILFMTLFIRSDQYKVICITKKLLLSGFSVSFYKSDHRNYISCKFQRVLTMVYIFNIINFQYSKGQHNVSKSSHVLK
jgi:hypothetical protein